MKIKWNIDGFVSSVTTLVWRRILMAVLRVSLLLPGLATNLARIAVQLVIGHRSSLLPQRRCSTRKAIVDLAGC